MLLVAALLLTGVYLQFRGDLQPNTRLTVLAGRSGLTMDRGARVTYNGVQVGRVSEVQQVEQGGQPQAKLTLALDPQYIAVIPANVDVQIQASTVFGNKYVALGTPARPVADRIATNDVIDATHVTTEMNTLFETVVSLAQQVDPVKLNATLSATAQALDGLGDRFGRSITDGNAILADLNAQMPQIGYDIRQFAQLADIYADASPDLLDALENAVITGHTLNAQRSNLDSALMASIGFADTGADTLQRSAPYIVRGADDLVPTSQLFDEYSPALFCTIRNYHDIQPKIAAASGGNGYSATAISPLMGAGNPYVYPDNLPRVNAHGGPEGRPGCWQPITRDLWPAPHLVMDTGASIAPYNHLELGQPMLIEYIWGRQVGENTINP